MAFIYSDSLQNTGIIDGRIYSIPQSNFAAIQPLTISSYLAGG